MSCTSPPDSELIGYVIPENPSLDFVSGSPSWTQQVVCADGYTGTPRIQPCTPQGTPYSISGCTRSCPPLDSDRNIDELLKDKYELSIKQQRVDEWIRDFLTWLGQQNGYNTEITNQDIENFKRIGLYGVVRDVAAAAVQAQLDRIAAQRRSNSITQDEANAAVAAINAAPPPF